MEDADKFAMAETIDFDGGEILEFIVGEDTLDFSVGGDTLGFTDVETTIRAMERTDGTIATVFMMGVTSRFG